MQDSRKPASLKQVLVCYSENLVCFILTNVLIIKTLLEILQLCVLPKIALGFLKKKALGRF